MQLPEVTDKGALHSLTTLSDWRAAALPANIHSRHHPSASPPLVVK